MRHPFVERSRRENLLITAMVTGIATVSASTSLLTLFSGGHCIHFYRCFY